MTKNWKKTDKGTYVFNVNEQALGTMVLSDASLERKALCQLEGNAFLIKRTGFWKSSIELSNQNGDVIAKVYPEKWYASSWILEYKNKSYKVIARNNPLAEYAIKDNAVEIAAYGLSTDKTEVNVRITALKDNSDYIFDFLLWYLFLPIAMENIGDDLTFLMLCS